MDLRPEETERTEQLVACLRSFDLFETEDEKRLRSEILDRIDELSQSWIRKLSLDKNIPSADQCRVKIFTFGSHKLGVQNRGDDIDILLVAPKHARRCDFFDSFKSSLSRMDGVSYVCAVETAHVPVIKTKINGIDLDFVFATLPLPTIPQNQELSDYTLLRGLSEVDVRSLNGCRVTEEILKLTPNRESFGLALRAIKLWAKKKGIYSQVLGYLGGVSWTILIAYTVRLYPHAAAATIVNKFFHTFSNWSWGTPVLLKSLSRDYLIIPRFRQRGKAEYRRMPIVTPSYPEQNTSFRVTQSAKKIIINQFEQARTVTDNIMRGIATWDTFFAPIDFFGQYKSFLLIAASSQPDWSSFVESKLRELVLDLDYSGHLAHAYPYPHKSSAGDDPNTTWFIGVEYKSQVSDYIIQTFKSMGEYLSLCRSRVI